MADKVSYEVARGEIEKWLDYKRVNEKKREEKKASIEKLIELVMSGDLVLDSETFYITQNLIFPITDKAGNIAVDKLKYKPRADTGSIQERTKTVSMNDIDGRLTAIASAVCDTAVGVMKKLDSEDISVANSIAVFFM